MLNLFQSNTTTVVYIANNGSNGLLMTTSTDLITWSKSTPVPGQSSRMAPAIVSSSGGFILVAYVAANGSNDLLVVQQDGDGPWSKSTPVNGQSSKMAPALSVTPNNPMIAPANQVVLTYVAANGSNELLMTTSTDLITWSQSPPVTGQSSSTAPALLITASPNSLVDPRALSSR
jgi:hypothetical protein